MPVTSVSGIFLFTSHVRGESRDQGAPFRASLDELLPADHLSRVIDAFAARLDLGKFGVAKASAAATGSPLATRRVCSSSTVLGLPAAVALFAPAGG
jgi:hypothetical protein